MSKTYNSGELIHHPKFGDGFVGTVLDGGKISIVFHDGARTLAHGQRGSTVPDGSDAL
jgi:hypothetical protein